MKRQSRSSYAEAQYPTAQNLLDRRAFLKGMGALVGASAAAAASSACFNPFFPPLGGEAPYPDDLVTVYLPAAPESQCVVFAEQGYVDYRLEVVVHGEETARFLEEQRDELLTMIDAALQQHAMSELAPEQEHSALETEITQILADAYGDAEGAPTHMFYGVLLIIDTFEVQ